MVVHRLRRWPSIDPTMGQCLVHTQTVSHCIVLYDHVHGKFALFTRYLLRYSLSFNVSFN